jgi:glycerate dehydrogenase
VVVCNIRNYAVHTVPEHSFALILALRRSLLAYRQDVARGFVAKIRAVLPVGHPVRDLHGAAPSASSARGAIGQGWRGSRARFGMRVLFADHAPPKAEGVNSLRSTPCCASRT